MCFGAVVWSLSEKQLLIRFIACAWTVHTAVCTGPFQNNIPPKYPIINCTLRIYWIDYCRIIIKSTDMKLPHFVHMPMCFRMVLRFKWSWEAWPKRCKFLMYTQFLANFKPIFHFFAIVTVYVLWKMPISHMNVLHRHLLKWHTKCHLIHKIARVFKLCLNMHPLSNRSEIKNQTFTYQEIEAFLLYTTFYYLVVMVSFVSLVVAIQLAWS